MKTKVIIGALGILTGLALGLVYGHLQLASVQNAQQAKLKEMNQRLSQAQHRFVAERTTLEDDSQALQAQLDALRKESEQLKTDKGQLKTKADALETRSSALDKKVASLEAQSASLTTKHNDILGRLAKAEEERTSLDRKEQQTRKTLEAREKELKQLNIDSRTQYDQCAAHNARLYLIADDLIHKYEHKGVVKTLLTKEPFTQVEKVEMEKLVQDYKDQINQQKMK